LTVGDGDGGARWTRRLLLGAGLAAPLAVAGAVARGARPALVGGGGFTDGAVEPVSAARAGGPLGGFPKLLRGPAGDRHVLAAPPHRIVSVYLGADELLADLVSPERIVAVSAYADDPATSNCAGRFPPGVYRVRSDPETILALQPDLVCVAGFVESDALRLLVGAGLPILRWSRWSSFADIQDALRLFGAALGEEGRAAALIAGIDALLGALSRRLAGAPPVRVLYYDPPVYTMGRGTLVDEILTRAGGLNVVAELGIEGPGQIGLESVLGLEPDVIILPRYADNDSALATLNGIPLWHQVPAVRAGRVHEIPGAWIATISHHAAQGLAKVASLLHPG
jgi:iron complex transport system substrate-binding protein